MYELQTKTILDTNLSKKAVFIPLSLYRITMIYNKYRLLSYSIVWI